MTTSNSNNQPPEHPTLSTGHLQGIQQMDPQDWSRLVNTFGPIVYRWCRTSGVPEGDAPDLVQDVFAAVARGIPKFRRAKEQGSFRAWLATITRNKVRDYFRLHLAHEQAAGGTQALQVLQQQAEQLDSTISPATIESPLIRHVLDDVKAEFEANTWNAFWQTTVDGQGAAEVADRIGISVASVYQAKSRVLRRLRHRLAQLPS